MRRSLILLVLISLFLAFYTQSTHSHYWTDHNTNSAKIEAGNDFCSLCIFLSKNKNILTPKVDILGRLKPGFLSFLKIPKNYFIYLYNVGFFKSNLSPPNLCF